MDCRGSAIWIANEYYDDDLSGGLCDSFEMKGEWLVPPLNMYLIYEVLSNVFHQQRGTLFSSYHVRLYSS